MKLQVPNVFLRSLMVRDTASTQIAVFRLVKQIAQVDLDS